METLYLAAGWIVVLFMAALAIMIIFRIVQGSPNGIDLRRLISEENGNASLSRFQFLVFTFVIAMGLLVVVLKTGTSPSLGGDILGLLGISAGSYVGAKITQKAAGGVPQNGQATPAGPQQGA